jgi:hypothetical protein
MISGERRGFKAMPPSSKVEDANHGGVATSEHAGDATGAASITARKLLIHKNEITLHGTVDRVGRDEDVLLGRCCSLVVPVRSARVFCAHSLVLEGTDSSRIDRRTGRGRFRPNEAEAIAVQIEAAADKAVTAAADRCLNAIPMPR